jgi:acyl-CoA reductase-like NAD-dependent aldehyde dehydrogenase
VQQLDPDLRALQEVRDFVERAKRAHEAVAHYSQAQIDAITRAMAEAAEAASYELGRVAVEETGIGRVHYKVLKNLFGSRGIWESIKGEKSVGIISRDEKTGVLEVATPVGVVAGIIPTTNPTSTAIGKALIAVKGRNAIVISPHPRARRCIGETVEVMRRAIERAGGPPDLVLSLTNPTIDSTGALMKHKHVSIILATGGSGLVQAAYSSGKPAYGVGPGNVPCYIDRSADVAQAARAIVTSQAFDNGTLCCSEQGLVIDRPIEKALIDELVKRGAHVCNEEETAKLARHCNKRGHMNPDVVGLDPWRVAEASGFNVPRETSVLLAWQGGVGPDWPLSIEILCPLLSLHRADGWEEGCRVSMEMLHFGGLGHTCGVHARDEKVLEAWFLEKPANRIIVNGPCSQGAVGYSTWLVPSMSLGCGPQAGNITSDNITVKHLLNVKRVAFPRRDWLEVEKRDHAWAAKFTREEAPRGSGLPGDPAMALGAPRASQSAFTAPVASNWQGNPAVAPQSAAGTIAPRASSAPASPPNPGRAAPVFSRPSAPSAGGSARTGTVEPTRPNPMAKVQAAPKSPGGFAPRESAHGGAAVAVLAQPSVAAFVAPPAASARHAAPYVGVGLSIADIQHIMSHAGAGCPLGPCKGCPHHDVSTGACTA